jgi:hypothetical protein
MHTHTYSCGRTATEQARSVGGYPRLDLEGGYDPDDAGAIRLVGAFADAPQPGQHVPVRGRGELAFIIIRIIIRIIIIIINASGSYMMTLWE